MSETLYRRLKDVCERVRCDEPIASHTTIGIGGPAAVMAFPRDEAELSTILRAWAESDAEIAFMGGGANLFADSDGFDGLIVNTTEWREDFSLGDDGLLVVGGGATLHATAREAARRGWGGVDFMGVVPGTVGGAVVMNAGTRQEGWVADRVEWVETLTLRGEKRRYPRDEMGLGYRTSRFLNAREIIVRAAFRLVRCETLGKTPDALMAGFQAAWETRRRAFPLDLPNFGSTFRNPAPPHPPAGKLIEEAGLKGRRVGAAQVSDKHANFVVNLGGATSADVLVLLRRVRDTVLDRFGVALEPEVRYLANLARPRPDFLPPVAFPAPDDE